jgi:hypothetical protein
VLAFSELWTVKPMESMKITKKLHFRTHNTLLHVCTYNNLSQTSKDDSNCYQVKQLGYNHVLPAHSSTYKYVGMNP